MKFPESEQLREYTDLLADVDLTDLGVLAREWIAADPANVRVHRVTAVADLMVKELWNRLPVRLTHSFTRQQQEIQQTKLKQMMLIETLQPLTDTELGVYAEAARLAILRTTNESLQARFHDTHQICVAMLRTRNKLHEIAMRYRIAARPVVSSPASAGIESTPKGQPWNGEDG